MRLSELEPQFYRYETRTETYRVVDGTWNESKKDYVTPEGRLWSQAGRPTKKVKGPSEYLIHVDSFADAHGIQFLCPKCFRENHGVAGTHHCQMPFAGRGVDPAKHKNQWSAKGTGYADLSTTPSYLIVGGCGWHGYITRSE